MKSWVIQCVISAMSLLAVANPINADQIPDGFFSVPLSYAFPVASSPLNLSSMTADIDANGFIRVDNGHFVNDAGRIRFFGVNLSFSAMFPDKQQAIALADQLAGLGVNCVRVHHIDKRDIWGEHLDTHCDAFDVTQLERMDFFIAQLRQRGIYINLNLHVSWQYRNTNAFAYADYGQEHARIKGFDLFMSELIGMQKEYARMLLTHVNPYTGKAYCDDPMLAMVEINNENGLTHRLMYKKMLDQLPEPIAATLLKLWRDELASQSVSPLPDVLPTTKSLKSNADGLAKYWVRFLYKLEKQYWQQMFEFVKKDCRVRVPVTGTQIDHTYPAIAQDFDYVDRHLYWKHPTFPNKSWDWDDYYIKNFSMVPADRSTFSQIAVTRIADKPFVISEYNHPFPLTYAAEAITMAAVMSRLQDYDGLFIFHFSNNLESEKVDYFSARFSHLKCSLFPFAAMLMRSEKVFPLTDQIVLPLGLETQFSVARQSRISINPYLNMLYYKSIPTQSLPMTALTQSRIGLQLQQGLTATPTDINALAKGPIDPRLQWVCNEANYKQSSFALDDPSAKAYIGWTSPGQSISLGNIQLTDVQSANGYFHFTCINQTGRIGQRGQYIIGLQSQHRYQNVDYLNYDTGKTLTIHDDPYGLNIMARNLTEQTTEYVEPLNAIFQLQLDHTPKHVKAFALDRNGAPSQSITCEVQASKVTIMLKKDWQTLSYVFHVD
jgi:hypothetical protein